MKLSKTFTTDTQFIVCVYEGEDMVIVTTYDVVTNTNDCAGRYLTLGEAILVSKQLVKHYNK
jgi:hypothetical protein